MPEVTKKSYFLLKKIWINWEHKLMLLYLLKWLIISSIIGCMAGSVSAFFLIFLEWATNLRESHIWIITFLPVAGMAIGFLYHYLGQEVEAGNNLLIEQIQSPRKIIYFRMAPLVLISTIITHLFGGSAGREGTAVQMGGAIADQLNHFGLLKKRDRALLLICGISAGFASVFGTPLAGAVFALEVFIIGSIRYNAIFPSFVAAIIGNYICNLYPVHHTHYQIDLIPEMDAINLAYASIAGLAFGLTATVFSKLTHTISSIFKSIISYAPMRPFIGGIVVAILIWLAGTTKYIGLGIPTIVDSFTNQLPVYDFALKIIFTALTLGAGFKGGEVTPLFFIGATLGNALSLIIPLPVALLAGMGFVAVFSGAANTPLATTLMSLELFGSEVGIYTGIACVVAYLFSGHTGIYSAQMLGESKHAMFARERGKKLKEILRIKNKK